MSMLSHASCVPGEKLTNHSTVLYHSDQSQINIDQSELSIIIILTNHRSVFVFSALRQCRVSRIYYGCPNDKFGGYGSVVDMRCVDTDCDQMISGGHRSEEAVNMLKLFYDQENPNAPNPKVKGVRVKKTF